MSSGTLIREAVIDDFEQLCELFEEVDRMHREAEPSIFGRHDGPARTRDRVGAIIESGDSAILVAEREGTIAGLVHLMICDTPDMPVFVPHRYALIDNLVVRPGDRRSGIGRTLLEAAHDWAERRSVRRVHLNVWEFNAPAIRFYESAGYRTARRMMCRVLEEGAQR